MIQKIIKNQQLKIKFFHSEMFQFLHILLIKIRRYKKVGMSFFDVFVRFISVFLRSGVVKSRFVVWRFVEFSQVDAHLSLHNTQAGSDDALVVDLLDVESEID
jgi:hypothetical protein